MLSNPFSPLVQSQFQIIATCSTIISTCHGELIYYSPSGSKGPFSLTPNLAAAPAQRAIAALRFGMVRRYC